MSVGAPPTFRAPTVVFDIGNVLVRWDPRNLYRKVFADDVAMEAFLATACAPDWLLEVDKGTIVAGVAARIAQFPHLREALTLFDTRWPEMLDGAIAENVALFARLKREGRAVYGITNYASDTFERSRPLFPFYDWFDGVIVSGREGLAKPDPRIFALLFARYDLRPADTLFVDDSDRNIAAARDAGMDTIHFGPGVDLAAEFARRGVFG